MRFFALVLLFCTQIIALDFGLKINQMNTTEAQAWFGYQYADSRKYRCNLRSAFMPHGNKGEIFKRMFDGQIVYKNFRSIACTLDSQNVFLWLIFNKDRLAQIKYSKSLAYEKMVAFLAHKYEQIASGEFDCDECKISDYYEFDVDENSKCSSAHCERFSIFKYGENAQVLLISSEHGAKSQVIIRSDELLASYKHAKAKLNMINLTQ